MDIAEEFRGAPLGDRRRTARLVRLATDLARQPAASFPAASRTEAATEATYRLLRNPHVTPEAIVDPHVKQTATRASEAGCVVVAHDTTEIRYSTDRTGLGRVGAKEASNAFFLHTALAVDLDTRAPLGVLGTRRHVRTGPPTRKKSKHSERKPEPQRESKRWWELVAEADKRLEGCGDRIHVCDREGDQFLLLARCAKAGIRFVIRGKHDRRVQLDTGQESTLRRVLRDVPPRLCRSVTLVPRAPKLSWLGTAKRGRRAKLEIRATSMEVLRPDNTPSSRFRPPASLTLHVVHVTELDPPVGFDPVDWLLLTTEPIETPEQIARVVDIYHARWVIEEYFKALKTGCAIEKRQLGSADTIFNAVAIFIPIAVRLLRLKHQAVLNARAPADTVLPEMHLRILEAHPDTRVPKQPTASHAWLAIARLGGHLKQNGPPGWQVLWRGLLELERLVEGAQIAIALKM